MKTCSPLPILLVPVALSFSAPVGTAKDMAPYPFTNTEGKSVVATFESQTETTAVVRMANGRQLKLPKEKLSKGTLKFLKGIESAGETKENTGREDAPILPTFAAGPYKGSFAVYEHQKFIAKVSKDGGISISLKDDKGNGIPNSYFTLKPGPGETSKEGFRAKHPESVFSKQKPVMQPTEVSLTGICRGDQPEWSATYVFSDNKIICFGATKYKKTPQGSKPAFEMSLSSPVLDRKKELTPEKVAELAGDSTLTVRRSDKTSLEYPFMKEKYVFSNDEKLRDGMALTAHITGKIVSPRKVNIGSTREGDYSLHFENKIMSRLSDGFKVSVRGKAGKKGSKRSAVIVSID